MNLSYVDVNREDIGNFFQNLTILNKERTFRILVETIIEAANLGEDKYTVGPFKLFNEHSCIQDSTGRLIAIYGYSGIIPQYILTKEVLEGIVKKFNTKFFQDKLLNEAIENSSSLSFEEFLMLGIGDDESGDYDDKNLWCKESENHIYSAYKDDVNLYHYIKHFYKKLIPYLK